MRDGGRICAGEPQRGNGPLARAGQDLEIMKRIKRMFDPQCLLNRGRLYNRI
jgi:FAD/FMN-containing dehydrogenase